MHRYVLRALVFVLVLLPSWRLLAAAPTATTSAASSITTSSASLNGAGVPNSEQTTGWFRISSTNPGTCDDLFGTRVPATGGTDLGAGVSSVPYSITATGLTSGVTYYFCAIVGNASGKAYGAILSFTVPGAPAVSTDGVSNVTSSGATLLGSADPNAASTTGWFRYSATDPGTCDDVFGTRAPSSGGSALGSGTSPVDYTRAISGLTPGATYYYCAIASNAHGTTFGTVLSFTALANAPVVTTSSATLVTGTTAQLNGSGNPGGDATTGWFRYSTTNPGSCNDSFGTRAPTTGGSALGSGNSAVAYGLGVTGLSSATTYYFCAIAENTVGKSFGAVLSFTTPAPPSVTSNPATSITNTSAYLQGAGDPNGASTTGWFRYSLTDPGTCDDVFGSRAPVSGGTSLGSGNSPVSYSRQITGLSAGTTYYYCAIASNSEGLGYGAVLSFTTADAPTVTTSAATLVTSSSATLNGSANPNYNSAYGYFRYSTSNPGTCNDSFGTRAPSSSGSDTYLGAGSSPVDFARSISGLTPGTTYYFCALGRNSYGTSFGAVLSFTTLAALPTVTTSSASLLTGTTAQLNGSANPGGDATSGWFRYATASPGTCNDSFGTRAPLSGGSDLGSGTSNVAFSEGITGLTAGTTYYYCAIAQNSVGTGFGSVQTFTTPLPPTVTSNPATSITNTTAYLQGAGNPNGSATTGWFRYSATDPGTCDDTFGSRAPSTGGTSLGSGTSPVSYSRQITGLSVGTTYYYCAIASSSEGIAFGAVLSFTTADAPAVTTSAATLVTSSSATLNGSANPNNNSAYGYFRYSTSNPGTCNDSFGTRAPSSSGSDTYLGAGSAPVDYARSISGLTPGTTYYFCALGRNSYGTSFGAVLSFTTLANAPTVTTNSASLLTGTTAQLNGSSNPGGAATSAWFRYATASPGSCNDSFGTRAPLSGGSDLGSGTSNVAFSEAITGLSPGTTYYYCAIAQNSVGMGFGSVSTFTTPLPPTVTTNPATSITNTSAYLQGAGNPNGSATTGWFRYSATDPGTCDDVFGSRAPLSGGTSLGSGTSPVSYSRQITGLSAGTTYYYCAIASSAEGLAYGAVLSFTTADAPAVTTSAATLVTSSSATLNGSANPNYNSAYGYFRYSTSNPGTCNDSFGTRAPSSSGSDTYLGAGSAPVDYARSISGLTPGTTYYFCALGRNSYGTSFGAVLSFTTLANAPTVTTNSASLLTGTTAQLNGSSNPGGAATSAWFRYATASPGTCNDSFGTRAPLSGGSDLGSGTSNVAFSEAVSGLTAGTTYYYCAIAQNAVGTGFGSVQTFTTPLPPTATTNPATSITNSSAYLQGAGDPNGSATTGWFRYSATDPGTCDDSFGSRAPLSGGTSLGSGDTPVSYSRQITGLSAGATYYYCAIVSSAEGTAFGAVLSFTTADAPAVTTSAATLVTSSSATLNGSANPNNNSAYGYFRYSTSNPGTCNDSFGTRAPSSSGSDTYLGAGSAPVDYARSISGLTPGTTYYFCALGRNSYGTSFGAVLSFTTLANAPTVTTNSASLLTGTTAQLNGSSNPGGAATSAWFRYATVSPGTCNDSFGTRAPLSGGSDLGSGTSNVAFSEGVTGLTAGTTYYYCAIAQNAVGTSFGSVLTFTTPVPPTVTTNPATSITNSSAYLQGAGTPNGSATTGWFRYALTDPGTCDDSFGSRAPSSGGTSLGSGTSPVSYSRQITGLSAGTTYYYCAIASSAEGLAYGAVLSFTTADAPAVTTSAATLVTSSSATLNGSANPNYNSAYGYFRYSTSNPGTCNDSFGTRAPSSSGSDTYLGAGSAPVDYARSISGLTPGTTYYYCAIARNTYGTRFGALLSFSTLATQPTVTTSSATSVTTNAATLNGLADPNGDDTAGWFRYATASPGTCNDSFGIRAPSSGGSPLGSGTSNVAFSEGITGLTPGTTYYYCAIAQNSVGIAFGAVLTFTTTAPPTVSTLAATPVTATTATLNASVDPNGYTTIGWFRYSTSDPGACDNVFGTSTPTSGLGSGTTPVALAQPLTGLAPATTYYFCAIAQSSIGTTLGAVLSFTTPAAPPSVTTLAATDVVDTSATLNGTVNPNGSATTGWFRYSTINPGTCNDSFGIREPLSGGAALGGGNSPVDFAMPIGSLSAGTTYYYCALASSGVGSSVGLVLSFTTPSAPSATTSAASAVTSNGATLNGSADPNLGATTGWFRYSTTDPGSCNDSFGTRAPLSGGTALGAGTTAVPYSEAITGLGSGTTYYFCAIAQNAVGTAFGAVLSFTTTAAPSVTTSPASSVTSTTATLEGSANPNASASTGWFRYSTIDPGTCSDSFGTRAPLSGGTTLGSGSSPVPYSRAITGLSAGTTYYFCAIASNGAGTGFGAVLSFTTPAAPTVTTEVPTSVTGTGATLNGTGDPNVSAATGWFRYSTTDPGSCNDSFGTRAPLSGGTSLGAGSSPVPYSEAITGLGSGITYYYCAIAQNGLGTGFGAVLSFTTPAAPTVTTSPATSVTGTTATLEGSGDPNLSAATGWFRYSTTDPGSCNDSFGTRAPLSGGTSLGAGSSPVPYSEAITGLGSGITYYYCAIAQNGLGTGFGAVLSFTTPAAPTVTTSPATSVTGTTATLEGSGDPNLSAATGWFRYSTTDPGSCNDSFGTRAPLSGGTALGAGSTAVPYAEPIAGLASGTTYYYCAIAQNAVGSGFGAVLSFTTAGAPTVATSTATSVASTTATLNGSADPNLSATTGWFRYSETDPGSCDDSFGTRAPLSGGTSLGAGTSAVPYSEALTGLASGTTYYYCAIAQNAVGTGFGAVLSFTTTAAPEVTTELATAVTGTTATLNGTANPNLSAATGWFRFSAADPGSCNDSFGTRAPLSGGTALGSGSSPVPYSRAITGLSSGTTYYYCAIADNSAGTGFGAVLSFTTPASPTVTTELATSVTSTSATLNGTANPNLSAATGWFRYSATDPGSCNDSFGTRAPLSGGTSLGAGTSAVPYSETLTGLASGTTYYYCAIAQNAVGSGFGALLSFTTPASPTVTTEAATAVTSTSATLNATANPNQSAATGWFRYSATDPGSCDDSFGTRAPLSGGTSLGSGSTAVPYSEALTGLASGTTYYYCAIADNPVGSGFGAVSSFTTPGAPTVTTEVATSVTSTGATLQGSANPNLDAATGWFRYSTADPGSCDDSFGTRAPLSGGTALGSGSTAVSYSEAIVGLTPATTYYYCAIADNTVGTAFGAVLSFTTTGAPIVTTEDATNVTSATATLNGTANPNLLSATGWFRYDTTDPGSCDDAFGTRAPNSGGTDVGAGNSAVGFSEAISGLTPGTTYYYCAIADNADGTSFGQVLSLTTEAEAPLVTTNPATSVEATSAVLEGSANPGGDATLGWFRYDTTDPGACDDSFGTRVPAAAGSDLGNGIDFVAFSEAIAGLTPATTYYYCAIAENSQGLGFGEIMTFVPGADPPIVTTEMATDVLGTSATLAGTANPMGTDGTGWFRLGDVDPGACDDSFGVRIPETDGIALGDGTEPAAYEQPVIDLEPNRTYYYCAAASNAAGAAFGEVLSFTTAEVPPEVETLSAVMAGGTLTLTGAGNPMGSESTAWFRYGTVDPGTCNDEFGSRLPAEEGTALGAGRDPVEYTESAVMPGAATYYYCAIAENAAGTGYGEVLTFEVPKASAPEPAAESGCNCRVGSRQRASAAPLLALLGLVLLRRRRRAAAQAGRRAA